MKKILIIFLIFVLVAFAFLVGRNIEFTAKVDATTTEKNNCAEISYPENALNRIGKDCDTLLKIADWHISSTDKSKSFIMIENANKQGYYLENSRACEIDTRSNREIENSTIHNQNFISLCNTSSDDFLPFCVIDDYTLALGEDYEERIVVEEVIDINENGSIIKAKIDRRNIKNDKSDIYFFVTNLEKLLAFPNNETGEEIYTYGGDFCGYSDRIIYFDR